MAPSSSWPSRGTDLVRRQLELAAARPPAWAPPPGAYAIGGCFVCFGRGVGGRGRAGEAGWSGAALTVDARLVAEAVVSGPAGAPYEPGLLALREGPLLEAAVSGLARRPDVLLVNGTGRDHPRRAGLALHLGAVLELPTVGVTHRPLLAQGAWPGEDAGARSPLVLDAEPVAYWLRTRSSARPLVIHPAWRTDLEVACAVVLAAAQGVRAPEPLRQARRLAREARASGHYR